MNRISSISPAGISEVLLLALVFLLPWQTRWIAREGIANGGDSGYVALGVYAVDILLAVLFCAALFASKKRGSTSIYSFMEVRLGMSVLLFVGFNFLSVLWAPDKPSAIQHSIWILLATGLAYLVAAYQDKTRLVFWSVAGLLPSAWLGIWQFVSQDSWAGKWLGLAAHDPQLGGTSIVEIYSPDGAPTRWLRAYGSFDHPNIFGGAMAVGIISALWLVAEHRFEKRRKIFLYASLITFPAALFASLSRSAWAGLLLGLFVAAVGLLRSKLGGKLRNFVAPLAVAVVVFAAMAGAYPAELKMRSGGEGRLEQKSLDDRALYFAQGEGIVKENPLFGVGAGNYVGALRQKYPDKPIWSYQPAHNVPLLIWAELGIAGVMLIVTIAVFLGMMAWKMNLFFLALLAVLLPSFLLDHWLWSLHFGVLFSGFLAGCVLNKNNCDLSEKT